MSSAKLSENIIAETKIGRIAEANPDLNYELIKDILVAQQEARTHHVEAYVFDNTNFTRALLLWFFLH